MRTLAPRARRRSLWILSAALVLFAGLSPVLAQTYWYESYLRSVELIEAGRYDEAATMLEAVIQEQPIPAAGVRIPGETLTYVPYYQRARIQMQNGDVEGVVRSLRVSEAFGAVKENRRTMQAFIVLRNQVTNQSLGTPIKPVASSER